MSNEKVEKFRDEVRKLAKLKTLSFESKLSALDSMAITEICMLAEEDLDVGLSFDEVKRCRTYQDLDELLASKVHP